MAGDQHDYNLKNSLVFFRIFSHNAENAVLKIPYENANSLLFLEPYPPFIYIHGI